MTRHLRRGRRGVTLIELLVAMTLFSLLSVAVLFSLRTGLGSLDRVRDRTAAARRQAGAQRSLELMLSGISPSGAQYFQPGQNAPRNVLFFQGDAQTMRFVSNYSLRDGLRTAPRLIELTVVPHPTSGVRLVMNERVYPGPLAAGSVIAGVFPDPAGGVAMQYLPVDVGPATFVVADLLPSCRFFYLEPVFPQGGVWRQQWRQAFLPKAIRIDMGLRTVTSRIYVSTTEL